MRGETVERVRQLLPEHVKAGDTFKISIPCMEYALTIKVCRLSDAIARYNRDLTVIYIDELVPTWMYPALIIYEVFEYLFEQGLGIEFGRAEDLAVTVERQVCENLSIDYGKYDRTYNRLIGRVVRRGGVNPDDVIKHAYGGVERRHFNATMMAIRHNNQRYNTIGDWWFDECGDLHIRMSAMKDWKEEALVSLHEFIEAILCRARGISEKKVMEFDLQFEKERKRGLHPPDAECGDDKRAPYQKEHFAATTVERIVADLLKVDWVTYGKPLRAREEPRRTRRKASAATLRARTSR